MATDENEGGVEVLVVFPRIVTVKLFRFSAVYREKVCAGVVCPEGLKEFLEGGTKAKFPVSCPFKMFRGG